MNERDVRGVGRDALAGILREHGDADVQHAVADDAADGEWADGHAVRLHGGAEQRAGGVDGGRGAERDGELHVRRGESPVERGIDGRVESDVHVRRVRELDGEERGGGVPGVERQRGPVDESCGGDDVRWERESAEPSDEPGECPIMMWRIE